MKPVRSFRPNLGHLPPRYRTPSPPPREVIEPLSPAREGAYSNWPPEQSNLTAQGLGLSLGEYSTSPGHFSYDQYLWVDREGQARIDSFNSNAVKTNATRPSSYDDGKTVVGKEAEFQGKERKGHTRSGSNIDALATIALATSPTFSQGSPSVPYNPWSFPIQRNGNHRDYALDERPLKRAKSEKAPSPQMERKDTRPATSHVASLQSMKDDAELLLNFAQTHNFPPMAMITPPRCRQREQESPVDTRLSPPPPAAIEHAERLAHPSGPRPNGPTDTRQDMGSTKERAAAPPGYEDDATTTELRALSSLERQLIAAAAEAPIPEKKKTRRVQPTTQAACPKCNSSQATVEGADRDGLTSWIGCDSCSRWFHILCSGFKDPRETRAVDKYICPDCEPLKGPTTFVRTSSRARTAIDYAGLHQGMIRSSEEMAEHHWLKPIKDGRIKFQPDDFARMRPELLTMEYLEKTDGLRRPTVVPACWNPRFGRKRIDIDGDDESKKAADRAEETVNAEGRKVDVEVGSSDHQQQQQEEVVDCGQDLLDMVMPENLTVRRVAELHGPELPLDVIDVKSQQTAQRWNLKKWADYYESAGDKTIRNVISLEVSQSKLGKLLRRPKIVRDLDLQDDVWPPELPSKAVQFYCLMSVADCYTDFHIDFGGSSVYYHILKGKKTFFFIPPEEKHLKKYEQWNNSPLQNQTFLGDVTGDCSRVDLVEGDTMLIPSGWIHAVWTPENSLVIGGNFLTRMSYEMQIKINRIEIDTKTALKFRYPLFQKVNWYAAVRYVEDDPVPDEILHEFEDDPSYVFLRANPLWHEFGELENEVEPGHSSYNLRFYSRMEIEGLPALRDYIYRTALIASDFHVEGISESARANVKRSVPKGHGEPLDLARRFGIWAAWKIGCVTAPDWVRPDSPSLASLARISEKQKKFEVRRSGERTSSRVQSQLLHARGEPIETPIKRQPLSVGLAEAAKEDVKRPKRTPKPSTLGPQRFACDPCRKRRIRCRHKDGRMGASATETEPAGTYLSISVETSQPLPIDPAIANVYNEPSSPCPAVGSSPQNSAAVLVQEVNGLSGQPTPLQSQPQDHGLTGGSSGKKGRSKACEECRKSKRRCIHDENGQIDPSKAAEPSKPRRSTSHKRPARLSDELLPPTKKSKTTSPVQDGHLVLQDVSHESAMEDESDSETCPANALALAAKQSPNGKQDIAVVIEKMDGSRVDSGIDPPARGKLLTIQTDTPRRQSPPLVKMERQAAQPVAVLAPSSSQISANSLVSPPDSLHNDGETLSPSHRRHKSLEHGENGDDGEGGSSKDSSTSTSSTANPLQTPQSAASRHSSRQPKPVDRYIPESAAAGGLGTPENGSAKQHTSGSTNQNSARRRSSGGRIANGSRPLPSTTSTPSTTPAKPSIKPHQSGPRSKSTRNPPPSSRHPPSLSRSTSHAITSDGDNQPDVEEKEDTRADDQNGRDTHQHHPHNHPHQEQTTPSPTAKITTPTATQDLRVKSHHAGSAIVAAATAPVESSVTIRPTNNESQEGHDGDENKDEDKESLELIRALHEEEFGLRRRGAAATTGMTNNKKKTK